MSVDSYLIECSHENAIVKDSTNNTYFTNKVGDGIQLNVNDKVSVHSAYIHEIGSGSESIEFDGNLISTESVKYTDRDVANQYYPTLQTFYVNAATNTDKKMVAILTDLPVWFGSHIYTLNSSGAIPASIPKENNVIVNNTYIGAFYGQYSSILILSEDIGRDLIVGDTVYIDNSVWLNHNPSQFNICQNKDFSYPMTDNKTNISYSYYKNADGHNCMMLPRLYFAKSAFPTTYPTLNFIRYDKDGSSSDDGVPENFLDFAKNPQDVLPYLELYRRKHDNSRYKIYTLQNLMPGVAGKVQSSINPDLILASTTLDIDIARDIALRDFIPYYDNLELSISSGYNTPSNIAQDLSSQLHKSSNIETKIQPIPSLDNSKTKDITLSVVIPSPTFKQFTCACVASYNETTYDANIANIDPLGSNIPSDYQNVRNYLASYTNIGVYDPNMFEAGRKLRRQGYLIRKSIAESDRTTANIVLNMEYTQENLLLWKGLFDAQASRDDLIFGTNVSTSNARFIHMNPDNFLQDTHTSATGSTNIDENNFLFNKLGDDGLRVNTNYSTSGKLVYEKTGQSARQYINYGYGDTNTFIDSNNLTLSDTNMSYGFATYTTVEEYDYAKNVGGDTSYSISYPVSGSITFPINTVNINVNVTDTPITSSNQVVTFNAVSISSPLQADTRVSSVSGIVNGQQTITLDKPTTVEITIDMDNEATLILTIPDDWQPITKSVKYITFLTNQVGGIQSKINLPITTTYLPPTSAAGGLTLEQNLVQFKLEYPQALIGKYPTDSIRFVGWDSHFSSFGNDCCILWSGYVEDGPLRKFTVSDYAYQADYKNIVVDESIIIHDKVDNAHVNDSTVYPTYAYVNWITLGSDNPLINFSDTGSRFTISELHTSPRQGNLPLAGRSDIASPDQTFPDNPNSNNLVYRINPQINRGNRNHGFFTYNPEVRQLGVYDNSDTANTDGGQQTSSICKLWTIFDSQTGIFIEDFGCSQSNWESSMWYKMGFDYSQLNGTSTSYNYQGRATNDNQSYFPITTNANVNTTQALTLMVNDYDGSQYTLQSPISGISISDYIHLYADGGTQVINLKHVLNPVMTEKQFSTGLTASRKPEKQIYGYYTIRSSLIGNSQYYSENVMLPVICVISKNYTGADFIFSEDNNDEFTVTKPTTITNITTSINMPNGKLARADKRSAVIYKVTKAFNYETNIAAMLASSKNKK